MNATTKEERHNIYLGTCAQLGFNPDVGFVKLTKQGVSFTCGKPDEIRLLLSRVRENGMTPSPKLIRAAMNS